MTWLAWRQFRAQAALTAALAVGVVVVLVMTRHDLSTSISPGAPTGIYKLLRLLGTGLIGVPAFVGAFWGAPLIARELETGTHRLAWTQSVTRGTWLRTKLAVVGAVTVVLTAAFSLVFTWWSIPYDNIDGRIGTANFGQRGIAPIGYACFALALGALLGLVLRRTIPAMVATLVGFFVVRYLVQTLVRPHLLPAETVTRSLDALLGAPGRSSAASGGWILSRSTVGPTGARVNGIDQALARACKLTRADGPSQIAACARRAGFHEIVKLQPADHFWPLQAVETALFLGFAAALVGACFWWIRHRAA